MTLEELLDIPDLKLVVLQHRYSSGWIAGIEIEDHPTTATLNDLNGDDTWNLYGLNFSDTWFPVCIHTSIDAAQEGLRRKISDWTKDEGRNVATALGIFRQLEQLPTYGVKAVPRTLPELNTWIHKWDRGEALEGDIVTRL